jgi:hypothetical protein
MTSRLILTFGNEKTEAPEPDMDGWGVFVFG